MPFTFVHAADLHLDTPFEGLGRVSSEVADMLRDASLDAYDALIAKTIQAQASFLVLSGDIYDGSERGLRAQLRFLKGLERLAEHGVQVFICHGNHDPLDGWSAIRAWPDNVTIFGSGEVERARVERDGSPVAQVHGISYDRRSVTENLSLRFSRGTGAGLHVAALHCNVGGNAEYEPYSPCTLEDLIGRGMDYWALGHVHSRGVLHEDEPWVVYPGNTQGRSLKPSEQGPKGAYVVEADEGAVRGLAFFQTDQVQFLRRRVDISLYDDLPALSRSLADIAVEARTAAGGSGLILDVRLEGAGPVHGDLACSRGVEEVLRELRDEFEGERPLIWWERLLDHTSPEVDLDAVRTRGDLASEICALVDEQLADPGRTEAFLDDPAYPDKPHALKRHLRELSPEEEKDLLERARLRAIELLDAEADACE